MTGIEEHIRRAMEEGKFDDLPGKGKPLRLDQDPHEDPEWRTAYRILRNSGFTLPWIEARREIEVALDDARGNLARAWESRLRALNNGSPLSSVEAEWERAEQAFGEQVDAVNEKILSYNLQVPSNRLQLIVLDAGREAAVITGGQ
jgi:DnaJ family protein C protein 28